MDDLFSFADATMDVMGEQPLMLAGLLATERAAPYPYRPEFHSLPPVPGAAPGRNKPNLGKTKPANFPAIWLPKGEDMPIRPWRGAGTFLDVAGEPSLKLYFLNGAAVIELRRQTRFGGDVTAADLAGMRSVQHQVLTQLVNMSQGPYSLVDLARMGHPYGFDVVKSDKGVQRLPRRVPRYYQGKRIGNVPGVRGSVPTLTVINKQSGLLAKSWSTDLNFDPETGILSIKWSNDAQTKKGFPYAWALAHGTRKMQSHGPWTYAPIRYMAAFDREWRKLGRTAWLHNQMDQAAAAAIAGA